MRIMTWNIHGGVGTDRTRDLQRVVDLVSQHSPDIVAIQEVDSRRGLLGHGSAFDLLAEALGPHSAEARLITAPDGDYGHAVISRWPFMTALRHDMSIKGREPRAAIETTINTPMGPIHLVAAHLGLSFRERLHQSSVLSRLCLSGPPRSIILGDFNDWIWGGSVERALADKMPARTHHKTFPARLPLFDLDRIYCRPARMLRRSWTDIHAWKASDHLPVIAEIDLSVG